MNVYTPQHDGDCWMLAPDQTSCSGSARGHNNTQAQFDVQTGAEMWWWVVTSEIRSDVDNAGQFRDVLNKPTNHCGHRHSIEGEYFTRWHYHMSHACDFGQQHGHGSTSFSPVPLQTASFLHAKISPAGMCMPQCPTHDLFAMWSTPEHQLRRT